MLALFLNFAKLKRRWIFPLRKMFDWGRPIINSHCNQLIGEALRQLHIKHVVYNQAVLLNCYDWDLSESYLLLAQNWNAWKWNQVNHSTALIAHSFLLTQGLQETTPWIYSSSTQVKINRDSLFYETVCYGELRTQSECIRRAPALRTSDHGRCRSNVHTKWRTLLFGVVVAILVAHRGIPSIMYTTPER